MIQYRRANGGDVEALARLRVEFVRHDKELTNEAINALRTNAERFFSESIADGSFTAYVADEDGVIVGTSGLTVYRLPPGAGNPSGMTAYISNMYTVPGYRTRGIATALFDMIVDEAVRQGCGRVMLIASDMGKPIYEKYGFTTNERAMWYFPQQ